MKTGIRTRVYTSTMCILRLGLLSTLAAAGPLLAQTAPANLVQIVRQATERFSDVNAATAAGLRPSLWLRYRAGYGRHGRALHQWRPSPYYS
jgi:hypothetical protein